MQEVGDTWLRVFVFRTPEKRVKRTHFNTNSAIHAQCVVNVETIEFVDCTRLATGTAWRSKFFVSFNVDAPVWTRTYAQHARCAVALVECNHSASAHWGCFLYVRVLNGIGALGDGFHHGAKGDSEAFE
jgi:hypothetical protein